MQKITSIHLNGKAYQVEEPGFAALREYLDRAADALKDNPDKTEIIADLEQAIGEKCAAFLSANKDVITSDEIKRVLDEMGPVHDGKKADESSKSKKEEESRGPKRFYLMREGAIIAGVCAGIGAYFDIDPMIVRAAFIILTILTGGAFILVYVALMFLVPYANTAEDRAAASGLPFNAQEVVNRAKESAARLTQESKKWERQEWYNHKAEWKRMRHELRDNARRMKHEFRYARYHGGGYSPVFGVLSAILAILWIVALITLIKTGAIFGFAITSFIPLWAAIVLLFIVYHAVTGPLRAAQWSQYRPGQPMQYAYDGWHGIADGLGVLFIIICLGFAYAHYPEVRDFVAHFPERLRDWWDQIAH